jgi:hypothetical protein
MMNVVSQKGTPIPSRMKTCKTFITRYKRAVAPRVREMIKNSAPVSIRNEAETLEQICIN